MHVQRDLTAQVVGWSFRGLAGKKKVCNVRLAGSLAAAIDGFWGEIQRPRTSYAYVECALADAMYPHLEAPKLNAELSRKG